MSVFCNVIKPQGLEPFQFSTKISSPSEEALEHQKSNGGKLGYNLVKLGFVKDEEIASLLSRQYGVPSINLSQFQIDAAVIKLVPAATVQKYEVVPVSRVGATLTIAMSDPTNATNSHKHRARLGVSFMPASPAPSSRTGRLPAVCADSRRIKACCCEDMSSEAAPTLPGQWSLHSFARRSFLQPRYAWARHLRPATKSSHQP